jgi:hypothetical protein
VFFDLNNPKKKIAWNDYGIFNPNQNQTEIAKTIANLIQIPADIDVNANDTTIVNQKYQKNQNNKARNGMKP